MANKLRDEQYIAYIDRHRAFVLEEAIKLGIETRGGHHDVSKFTPEEFTPYAEYFYGGHERGKVPAEVQEAFDYAWLLHQKRNDHHWQYWVLREDDGATKVLKMSDGAMRELVADWRGAGRAIMGDKADAGAWYLKNRERIMLHPETRAWVEQELGVKYGADYFLEPVKAHPPTRLQKLTGDAYRAGHTIDELPSFREQIDHPGAVDVEAIAMVLRAHFLSFGQATCEAAADNGTEQRRFAARLLSFFEDEA